MNQRGLIQLSLMGWLAVGAAAIILVMYLRIQYLETKVELADAFKAQVQAHGEAAAIRAKQINEQNRLLKEWADADYERLLSSNAVLFDQLRRNTARGHLSGNEATTRIAENACVNGKAINDAVSRFTRDLEEFTGRAAEIVIFSQQALDQLNNAKRWGQEPLSN